MTDLEVRNKSDNIFLKIRLIQSLKKKQEEEFESIRELKRECLLCLLKITNWRMKKRKHFAKEEDPKNEF